jgi:hypothetical protein
MGFFSRVFTWLKLKFSPGDLPMKGQELPQHSPAEDTGDQVIIETTSGGKGQAIPSLQPDKAGKKSNWGGYWLEWLLIFLAVTLFCAGILDLRAATRLPGNESEVFQMLDWTLVNSIQQYHAFPLWNIYIQSGLPYVADPMLHVYNPVVTVPVLLFGVRAGFKLGVYFSFLIAAFGMWRLAKAMGLGRAARLWTALMFAFAGQPIARFFQGQYLFIFGFAYIPWIISSLVLVAQHLRRRDMAIAAGSLALLFFSGNAYYPLYMLLVIGLFMLIMLLRIKKQPPFITLDVRHTFVFLGIGTLAVGMIAIQLLPTAEFWPRLSKDLNLAGSQTVKQIFLDYTSKDSMRPDAYSVLPAREEFYAYIGLTPFLGLALLPLAIWKRNRKMLLFFALIVFLTVGWISLEWMPWKETFLHIRLFLQFRHLLRILVFGSFALICLAGIGLDTLWKLLRDRQGNEVVHHPKVMGVLSTIGLVMLGAFMLFGVGDLFTTNQSAVRTQEIYPQAYHVMNWVRQNDLSDYYIRHNPTNAWQDAVLSNNLRYLDAWYHFADIRSMDGKINQRYVQALPNYLTQSPAEQVPNGGELIAVVDDYNIFSLPESLPLAFMVDADKLQMGGEAGPLVRSEVTPLIPFFSSPNKLEAIAEGLTNQILVVMMTRYPGWKVFVDGKFQELENVSGYMAVDVQPGVHKYTFLYTPRLFFIGLVISLIATVSVLGLFISDLKFDRQTIKDRWHALWDGLKQARQRLPHRKGKPRPITGEAVYREGILRPTEPLALDEDSNVRLMIEPQIGVTRGRAAWQHWVWATSDLVGTIWHAIPFEMVLFTIAIGLYLSTRLIGLSNFPIYFFTDEAVQTVMAEDFVHNGLRNYNDELLPTYFNKDSTYNLSSVSVYVQVIPYLLFGKSVFATRAVSVLISTLGALAVGLILRDIFKLRYWWCGVLFLSIAPAWFLHSRTAFETVEMASFYAGFMYFYLRYRYISPRALYGALVMGALVFYTYSPGQLIIVVTGMFLLFSDLRYHWQNRKIALRGLLLLAILVLPYLRYSLAHPEALMQHLSTRAPYWTQNISIFEKLRHYFSDYLYGLNPLYWFVPNQHDLDRHLMKGYGHLLLSTLPFFGLGLAIVLIKLRSSAYRTILFTMLAAPSGSALVGIGITRILVFVIPAVLMMALGLELLLSWLERGVKWILRRSGVDKLGNQPFVGISLVLVVVLGIANLAMLRDALVNGPTWYQDYTLAGMQYGASQLFEAVNKYTSQHPDAELMVSPSWTNGADAVAEFFLPPNASVRLGSIEGHLFQHLALNDQMVFVMIPTEMDKVVSSGKFKNIRVDKVLPYPNGAPGFYFVHLQYVDNIDKILVAEQEVRSALQETTLTIQGNLVQVRYSMLDMGSIELVFDGDKQTVARTLEANPFIIELTFPEARQLNGYKMILGSADVRVTALLYPDSGGQPVQSMANFDGSVSNPELDVNFGQAVSAQKVRFEIFQPYSGVPANVHVWEIELKSGDN